MVSTQHYFFSHSFPASCRWHRLGISVKGNSVTLLVDCEATTNMLLPRHSPSHLSNAGIILIGQQLLEDKYFDVSEGLGLECSVCSIEPFGPCFTFHFGAASCYPLIT